ncbi:MAG: ATP-dependent sacrificial sulfur transferase LarE [Candidatus Bathyarchaeia archaeon]
MHSAKTEALDLTQEGLQQLEPGLQAKFSSLVEWLRARGRVLIALSGGVDSSFLAAAARIALADRAVVVTADSVTLPPGELSEAKKLASSLGLRQVVVKENELQDERFALNPPDRCYYCKMGLIKELRKVAAQEGIDVILDGTNADDLKGHRPGALALREGGVRSPLAELGFTKNEIRAISKALGLPTWSKPSMACLSSRFEYGQRITAEGLHRVGEAESFIRTLTGVRQLRVRCHGELARIEVGKDERSLLADEDIMDRVSEKLRALGFRYVTLDLTGYRTGSMDEALAQPIIPEKMTANRSAR